MLHGELVQAGQRRIQLPQDFEHEVGRKPWPLHLEKVMQAAVPDVLHEFPPPAGVLTVGLESDHMSGICRLHQPDHVLFWLDVLSVHLGHATDGATGTARRVASLDDVEIGFPAPCRQRLNHVILGGQGCGQPGGDLLTLRWCGEWSRWFRALANSGCLLTDGGREFGHSNRCFPNGLAQVLHENLSPSSCRAEFSGDDQLFRERRCPGQGLAVNEPRCESTQICNWDRCARQSNQSATTSLARLLERMLARTIESLSGAPAANVVFRSSHTRR